MVGARRIACLAVIMFAAGNAGDDVSGLVFLAAALVEIGVLIGVLLRKIASGSNDSVRPSGRVE